MNVDTFKPQNANKLLKFIHARLEKVHGENPNVDYMLCLKYLAENLEPAYKEPTE